MKGINLASRIRRSILLYLMLSILITSIIVAIVSIIPSYKALREKQIDKLITILHTRATRVEIYLWELKEIAQQISSRTSIREYLELYISGKSELETVSKNIRESIIDAVKLSPNIASVYYFIEHKTPFYLFGIPLPTDVIDRFDKNNEEGVSFSAVTCGEKWYILYNIPIRDRKDKILGMLVLLFDLNILIDRLSSLPDIGYHENTFVGCIQNGKMDVFIELHSRDNVNPHVQINHNVLEALELTAEDLSGVLEFKNASDQMEILAYRPIARTDWGIVVCQAQSTLLSEINKQLYTIISVVFILIVFISAGMFLLLLPLSGKLILHSQELEKTISQKTEDIEKDRQRLLATTKELNEKQLQLQAVNEDLEAFSRTLAHDLRSPIVTIMGYSEILLRKKLITDDSETQRMLERIAYKGSLMAKQISSLFDYARAGKSEINRTELCLNNIIAEITADLQTEYPNHKVKLSIEPDMNVSADETLIYIVMKNLIGNAWKYTLKTESAHVEIGIKSLNDEKMIFIRDNGIGFDMMFAEKIFQPFQRLHTESEFSGTGIGLSTVRRIIENHGGKIWAEGKLGEGSVFYFTLSEQSDITKN